MSWASLSSNETFTFTEAQGSGIGEKISLPTSDETMSKNDCLTYLNNDTSVSSFAALAGNELATKADMAALSFPNSDTLYFYQYAGGCVTLDTPINIDKELTLKASMLKVGDYVYSYNERVKSYGKYKILNKKVSTKKTISLVTKEGMLSTSLSHKLMVNGKWSVSGKVKIGDQLWKNGKGVTVDYIIENKEEKVIEFSIEGAQTYLANGFLSHNKISYLQGWSTGPTACSSYGANSITAYWTGTLGDGTKLYSSSAGSFLSSYDTTTYFYMNGYNFYSSTDYTTDTITVADYFSCSSTFILSWNIYNPTNNPNAEAIIKLNGSTIVSTQMPVSNSTTFNVGDSITGQVNIISFSGQTQSISITGGVTYYDTGVDTNLSSGNLFPTADTNITIYLS